jgi:PAS domain S-box-containing protein
LKGEIPPPIEFPYVTKGGETKWGEAHLGFLESEENKRTGFLAVVRDITWSKEAEDERSRYKERLEALHQHAINLSGAQNRNEIARVTMDMLGDLFSVKIGSMGFVEGNQLRFISQIGTHSIDILSLAGPGITVRAVNTGKSQLVNETIKNSYFVKGDQEKVELVQSELAVPILFDGKAVGVIDICDTRPGTFSHDDLRLLETLASHVASATSRLDQNAALQESMEKYRTFVESSMDAVYVVQEGGIVYANKVGAELLGYTDPSDVIGINPLDLVPHENRRELDERLARTWRGEEDSGRYEMQVLRKDGSRVDIETFSANILYEGKPARLAFDRDITERKRMEEELRIYADRLEELVAEKISELSESEEMFRTIFVESPIGIEIYDAEGRLLSVNEACMNIFGIPDVNTVRGFKLFEDPNIPEDMKQKLLQGETVRYMARFDFDKVREQELYDTKKSGSILTDVGITPLSGEGSQNPAGYLVLVQDITEQKRMEEELIDASKMLAAGSIASMLGHDLRGPLMLIKNALYLMEKTPESADKSREIISNAVDHASEMLEELRSSTRDTPLQLIETNLGNLISQVVEDVSIPSKVTLTIDLGEGLDMTLMDPAKMRRVLGNLFRNAVEAMPEGGELTVSGEIEGGDVVISVRDTGKGIPVEQMPDLFKPFVTTKSKGMGLGLPYCKRAVEAHGGSISVESNVDVGSTVIVRLPLDPKP